MITVLFTLTMPNSGSWNGQWSGASNKYIISRRIKDDRAKELDDKYFYHNFGDGWGAGVSCKISASSKDTKAALKDSAGFCNYDWMVNNIISHGQTKGKDE